MGVGGVRGFGTRTDERASGERRRDARRRSARDVGVAQPLDAGAHVAHQVAQRTVQRQRSALAIQLDEEICAKTITI